ncbi:hypothetical protein J155_00115 [Xanthomonas citri pv. citri]|nr:hypothetical protein J151_00116 [Xanthomonas citri subsp. citri A306]AJY80123.1 hypothetical protein J159_00114 [Xanthomonas citri pv. citri]AJY84545.1 hypothetical protein J158_00114 [Xanthomonas citri subsp. citri UI6]AJY88967.1 hypothetical protein J169_00112 [Xanthomonas citri pv. citri]AJY93439.1 hypothetical protein J164_00113 [Xanthomonas citri pv. citri]
MTAPRRGKRGIADELYQSARAGRRGSVDRCLSRNLAVFHVELLQ